MANHGSKFVSVNLNKSYGQQHQPSHHTHYPHYNGGGSSYGKGGATERGRGVSGGAGGMVVLSRTRGAPSKVVPKLSVPPPLNLPSLRKEHEKYDVLGLGGSGAGAGIGSVPTPTSSGVGWTKPAPAAASTESGSGVDRVDSADGVSISAGSYMPPSARYSGAGVVTSSSASRDFAPRVEKAMVLRGEDFPSLQAARPVSSGTPQKQKDASNQKQNQTEGEELIHDKKTSHHLGPVADARPLGQHGGRSQVSENRMGGGSLSNQTGINKEYFRDPLPLVRVNSRSDWADDERDTGHGFVEQTREIGFPKSGSYWDRDFDFPRPSVLPHKPVQSPYERRGQRDNETGNNFSSEILKIDHYKKDSREASRQGREANKWRSKPLSKDLSSYHETGNYKVDADGRMTGYSNITKENKYSPPHYGENSQDGSNMKDSGPVWRQQQRSNSVESFSNRGTDRTARDHHASDQKNGYKGDNFHSHASYKSSLYPSSKLPPMADPILTMGWDKRLSKTDKPLLDDDSLSRKFDSAIFDERDLFSGGLVGVIKRKKDTARSTDFHDPVRESFEAELERVQKMQELERQRVIEEQERALEQVRRKEEERQRRIREEEEQLRRLEEEARETAWRAEQERLEAIRRAEEQRLAREEEKKRIQLEEERRKQAAKQMLEELEARMAKRQAEVAKGDISATNLTVGEKVDAVNEKHVLRKLDLDSWEDGERMVENVTSSGSFNSFSDSKAVETSLKSFPPKEFFPNFQERGKSSTSWRKDVFENDDIFPSSTSDQETGQFSQLHDSYGGSRAVSRKDSYAGAGYVPSRALLKAGLNEPSPDDFGYQKDRRWGVSGNSDLYGKFKQTDPELKDDITDGEWALGHSRGNIHPPHTHRFYPHGEANDLYSYGRSRYMRQPRVLPPPSLASAQRTSFTVNENAGPATFSNASVHYTHTARTELVRQRAFYDSNQRSFEPSEIFRLQEDNITSQDQKLGNESRCDSQSSLSVSSPPVSPPHLSQDELDESEESRVTSGEGNRRNNESVVNSGNGATMVVSDSISAVEDGDWTHEDFHTLQLQEEYDEDEDGYREDDEIREGDSENIENQKFGPVIEESAHIVENVVLGFDEGVEVEIPSDDFDKDVRAQDALIGIPGSSFGIVEEKGSANSFSSIEQNLLLADDSLNKSEDSSSLEIPEKSPLQNSGVSDRADVDFSDVNDRIAHVSSSGNVTAGISLNNNMPSLVPTRTQGDFPVKLQFGLFSGPSLVPSPVPAIQIGSIQMPLHIHPPVGQSITHLHPSQPSIQFGQLHYTSSISQEMMPIGPQSMPFVQPNILGHLGSNKNAGGSTTHEPSQDASTQDATKDEMASLSISNQQSFVSASPELSNGSLTQGQDLHADSFADNYLVRPSSFQGSGPSDKKRSETGLQAEDEKQHNTDSRCNVPSSRARGSEYQLPHAQPMKQSAIVKDSFNDMRGLPRVSRGRGKRFTYAVKNAHPRSSSLDRGIQVDSNGFQRRPRRMVQRTEFQVREKNDCKAAPALVPSNERALDYKSNYMGKAIGTFPRSGSKRSNFSNRTMKQRTESAPYAPESTIPQDFTSRGARYMPKGTITKGKPTPQSGEVSFRRNTSEEDVDTPLQSGVVRVFTQPGIDGPSDEDDFIEVRSKRQMLNDRREQRQKEIKAKSRSTKPLPRKQRAPRQKDELSRSHSKATIPLSGGEASKSQQDNVASESPRFTNSEVSTGYATQITQPPIGTAVQRPSTGNRPVNPEPQTVKVPHSSPLLVVPNNGKERDHGQMLDSKNKVMSLCQNQIDEAMTPAPYNSHASAVGGHSSTAQDPVLPEPSILAKDKSLSSGASPISSLLAGEKIQFGAVTSPAVLPPNSRVVSHGIGPPGSNRTEVKMSHSYPASDKESSLFFEKEKHLGNSYSPLQDSEVEAEAAASAVAVAAISTDEIIRNDLGSANANKSFGGVDTEHIRKGVVRDQQSSSQSRVEELSVSLPADLSVETTPISLWPPLPSPQSSSGQMLSHFPAGPHSHFPLYEMNQLLGPPIFAFSPHEESSGAQSQPQKSSASGVGPHGNWQQARSGVDSFYGPPAGYSGTFIGPPGGIPGVHGPPVVVYNHFTPVGQYGQVGLSFVGATYIPPGKQAEWKNSSSSSTIHIGEGDINNANMNAVQRSAPGMVPPVQNLAPTSPLLPMPSSLPIFDISRFQAASDLSAQARWGHISGPAVHPVPICRPLQPQVGVPSQVNHGDDVDQSLAANRFAESRVPPSSDAGPSFAVADATPFPSELGLVNTPRADSASPGQNADVPSSSVNANAESAKVGVNKNDKYRNSSPMKTQFPQRNAFGQQGNTAAYNYQRGGMAQRNHPGNDWTHRRVGYHGRNRPTATGGDKGIPAAKVRQIYVAKQTSNPT